VALLLAPQLAAAALGLPRPGSAFWPRLLGSVLVGVALASALQGILATGRGLALGGSIALNLATSVFLLATVTLGPRPNTRRGRLSLWLLLALLVLLSLVEIAAA
jgi:hypothetical protein